MLVLPAPPALTLIRQADHAALAGQLVRAWRRPTALPPGARDRLILAVDHHDDGWALAERKPVLDTDGRPLDFAHIPTDQHVTIWRRSVDLAADRDPYVGLLVAHHARHLYTTTRIGAEDNPAIAQAFITELALRIVRCSEPLALGDAEDQLACDPRCVILARRLLSFFDGLSLALCGAIGWHFAAEPVAFADTQATMTLVPRGDDAVTVAPWPFEGDELVVTVPAAQVPDEAYADADAFARTWQHAPVAELRRRLHPA